MVIIKLELGDAESSLLAEAERRNISVDKFVSEIVHKYLPTMHKIDKEEMAEGYKEMGEINLSIANGDDNKTR